MIKSDTDTTSRGVKFALGACFLWGLIFIVPQFMNDFSAVEVALGRYLVYGTLSLIIFCKLQLQNKRRYSYAIWKKALYFSLISTMGYYTFVVLALQYANPAICALILGVSPITIAFLGNWKERETSFKSLLLPSILILLGLIIINVPYLITSNSPSSYSIGLLCGFLALAAWSVYAVANLQFLKRNVTVGSSEWTTLIGVATLFWVVLFALFFTFFFENQLQLQKYFSLDFEWTRFFIGSAILGLLSSWVAASLWNHACLHLSAPLAGQLTIFETIFGVLFVYMLAQKMPSFTESFGIIILLIAIIYGIRQFSKKKSYL